MADVPLRAMELVSAGAGAEIAAAAAAIAVGAGVIRLVQGLYP